MPSITLAVQRRALLAVFTWQGSQTTAVFKANREHQCVSVCLRENTQFLLVRLSTAVDKWSQAAHKLPHIHKPTAGFTSMLLPCSAKSLKKSVRFSAKTKLGWPSPLHSSWNGLVCQPMSWIKQKRFMILDFSKSVCHAQTQPPAFNDCFFGEWGNTMREVRNLRYQIQMLPLFQAAGKQREGTGELLQETGRIGTSALGSSRESKEVKNE